MNDSAQLVKILQEMVYIMSSDKQDRRLITITNLYARVQKANEKELNDIGREILQLCRGGMGSFFDIGAGSTASQSIRFFELSSKLFDAAIRVIS
jgi:hypothetical protein